MRSSGRRSSVPRSSPSLAVVNLHGRAADVDPGLARRIGRMRQRGTMAEIGIRKATVDDAAPVARLVSVLGYPTSDEQMRLRLDAIAHDSSYDTLVACDGTEVVGFIGTRLGRLYEDDEPYGQIMALAVAAEHRRRGIGRSLVGAAESLLVERGAHLTIVTSGNHRADAHAFYESCGYTFTGRRYRRSLHGSPDRAVQLASGTAGPT